MNLLRPQTPYEFFPPKYSRTFSPFLHLLSRVALRCAFRVVDVRIEGEKALAALVKQRQTVLVAPNHADHVDPDLMITAGRRCGVSFHFMAAREGFERRWINRFIMQRAGAFSVNREGGDLAAIKTAIKVLQEARHPLVVFPEGEIYHHMESLDELNEGVAKIMLRACSGLPEGRKGYVIPTAIRLQYDPSVSASFSERLSVLEQRILWKPRVHSDPIDRVLRLGSALLAVKEEEVLGQAQTGELVERIRNLRQMLVEEVEALHGIANSQLSLPKRIKAARAIIRKQLLNPRGTLMREREEALYDQLDRLFLAHQLYSYPGTYLRANPSVDRIAETIFKLEEDVFGKARYLGNRRATVRFGEPIDVQAFLDSRGLNAKSGTQPLTERIREAIIALMAD